MDALKLVENAKQGDTQALIQLVMAQQQDYYRLAYVYMKNEQDALDAMEDMIIAVYENIHQLKKNESFYSWSKTILVNCCKKLWRKQNRLVSLDHVKEEGHDAFEQTDEQMMLEAHLSRLHHKYQEVIKLRYYLGLDYQSIADLLNIPLGTVKSRISLGLDKLAQNMGGDYHD